MAHILTKDKRGAKKVRNMKIKDKRVIEFNEAEERTLRATVMIWNKFHEYLQSNKLSTEVDFEAFMEQVVNKGEIEVYE